jgi:hypothetical protein
MYYNYGLDPQVAAEPVPQRFVDWKKVGELLHQCNEGGVRASVLIKRVSGTIVSFSGLNMYVCNTTVS